MKTLALVLVGAALQPAASAMNISYIDLTAPDMSFSTAGALEGTNVVGIALIDGTSHSRSILWHGSASSYVDLTPAGSYGSAAYDISGSWQVGSFNVAPTGVAINHAALWSGTAASVVDLNPSWANSSIAQGVSETQQVGFATSGSDYRAVLWSGSAGSVVNLNPAGALHSLAFATDGSHQVGFAEIGARQRAILWSGTAVDFVDLNPAGAVGSRAFMMSGSQQVGMATIGVADHAALWSGTADSFVDLNPAGFDASLGLGADGPWQVGQAVAGGRGYAALWSGTSSSFVNLSDVLDTSLSHGANAAGVWRDGSTLYISGTAYDSDTVGHAILWTVTDAPEPGSVVLLVLGGAGLLIFRRKRSVRSSSTSTAGILQL